MTYGRAVMLSTCVLLFMLTARPGIAADAPAPKEGHWVVRDFRFHTGEVREIKRVTHGRYVLIPASEDTRGHGTTGMARLWKHHLAELLTSKPPATK